jgi:hypothetical protein
MAHGAVVERGKEKADADLLNGLFDHFRIRVQLDAQGSSTSALPHLEETLRLPCLATVTPQPATTKAVVVEMLKVLSPSPPVPQVSTTGMVAAWMRWAFLRMARAAPANSSNVSPLVARAAIMAPTWASVVLPSKISDIISAIWDSLKSVRLIMVARCSLNMVNLLFNNMAIRFNCNALFPLYANRRA